MSKIVLQSPSSPTSLESIQLTGDWYVRHSTRSIWDGKRNVQVHGSENAQGQLPSDSLAYSYQFQDGSGVKTRQENKSWKVLGRGKDGRLEAWMKETPAGIEDSAGEIRCDWRTSWIVVCFFSSSLPAAPHSSSSHTTSSSPSPSAGIDILTNRATELRDDTLKDIQDALDSLDHPEQHQHRPELSSLKLSLVARDGARDEEMLEKREAARRQWEKRSGPQEGISPDLTYDDVDDDGKGGDRSRCIVS